MSDADKVLVLSLPGLCRGLLEHVPSGSALGRLLGGPDHTLLDLRPSWPAVTCSVQATLTTGLPPAVHGIIANGLPTYRLPVEADLTDPGNHVEYRRAVSFWEQSNQLVAAPRFWTLLPRHLTTAMVCFQHSMPGFHKPLCPAADIVLTPKPEHGPDGRITSLLWTSPPTLGGQLQRAHGVFPLQHYWGPAAGIAATRWIAAASTDILREHRPDLAWVYLPHLDYDLQRFGPDDARIASAVADLASAAETLLQHATAGGYTVVLLSEYAISRVERPLFPNRLLREAGLLRLTRNADGPLIDYAGSDAWALCDHQVAHVYCRTPDAADRARTVLCDPVRGGLEPADTPIAHPRAGQLQLQAPPDAWLDYRWWGDDEAGDRDIAPDWATTVDIHRKPGYDPLELFPGTQPRRIATDARRVRGSHGRTDRCGILLLPRRVDPGRPEVPATAVARLLMRLLGV
ncbi:MAG: alkaline phosphatase family protein [Tepidisphaerales bacterium]